MLVGKDFALFSEETMSYENYYQNCKDLEELQYELATALGNDKTTAYVVPNLYRYHDMKPHEANNSHIDLFMLLCPERKLFLLDTNHIKTYYKDQAGMREELATLRDIITNYA